MLEDGEFIGNNKRRMIINKTTLSVLATAALTPAVLGLSFDANVNTPGPGVFFGSGNANGGWTVDSSNGIELGLRTKQRYPSPANVFNSSGNGVYSWSDQLGYGPSGQNRASWNYEFSLNVAGTPSQNLSNYDFRLYIDSDPGAGQTWSIIDPEQIPDNAVSGTAYEQNSENPRFAFVGIPGYNNTIAGTYDFVLRAYPAGVDHVVLASTFIRVNVNGGTANGTFSGSVPDGGSSLLLFGSAASALALLGRNRRK